MSKDDFNNAGKILNEYNLQLRRDAGGRYADPDPLTQAELFQSKLQEWLVTQGDFTKKNVTTMATLGPSADGSPAMRIVCTQECMDRIAKKFDFPIVKTTLMREDVNNTPAPGGVMPKDRNCWDPTKWKK